MSLIMFLIRHPTLTILLSVAAWSLYRYLRRRWRIRQMMERGRIEQRRRAGIPDSDTRPWLVARPAAELRRREEVTRRQAEEFQKNERIRLAQKKEDAEEWGHNALRTLRRLQSQGELRSRTPALSALPSPRRVWIDRRDVEDSMSSKPRGAAASPRRPLALPSPIGTHQSPIRFKASPRPDSGSLPSVSRQVSTRRQPSAHKILADNKKRARSDEDEDDADDERIVRRHKGKGKALDLPSSDDERFGSDSGMAEPTSEDSLIIAHQQSEDMDVDVDADLFPRRAGTSKGKRAIDEVDSVASTTLPDGKRARGIDRKSPSSVISNFSRQEAERDAVIVTPGRHVPLPLHSTPGPDGLPVYGDIKGELKDGTRWTDRVGVEWFRSSNNVLYRQGEIRVNTLKYRMPHDSEHPDARAEEGDLAKVWLEVSDYERLKAAGQLLWQEEKTSPPLSVSTPRRLSPRRLSPRRPSPLNMAQRSVSRNHAVRVGLPGPLSKPSPSRNDSPYYNNVATFDRQLNSPSNRSRFSSPNRYASPSQRRQLSEAGRAKRHDDLLAKLGYGDDASPGSSLSNSPSNNATPVRHHASGSTTSGASPLSVSVSAVKDSSGASPQSAAIFSATDDSKTPESVILASAAPSPAPSVTLGDKAATPVFSFGKSSNDSKPISAHSANETISLSSEGSSIKDSTTSTFSFGSTTPKSTPKESLSQGNENLFSFGKADGKTVEIKPLDKPAFSFGTGAPLISEAKPAAKPTFSFGTQRDVSVGAASPATPIGSTNPASTSTNPASPSIATFSFGSSSKPTTEPRHPAKPTFSFEASPASPATKPVSETSQPSATSSLFSFSTPSTQPTASETKSPNAIPAPFSFATPATSALSDNKPQAASQFSFTASPAHHLNESVKPSASNISVPAPPSSVFGLGSTGTSTSSPSTFSFGSGVSSFAPAAVAAPEASTFFFGAPSKPAVSSENKPILSLGSSISEVPSKDSKSTSSVDWSTSTASSRGKPLFSFGAPSTSAAVTENTSTFSFGGAPTNVGNQVTPKPSSFSFGSTPTPSVPSTNAPNTGSLFGNTGNAQNSPSVPSVVTQQSGTPFAPLSQAATSAAPGFSFGMASGSTPAFSIGSAIEPAGGTNMMSSLSSPGGRVIKALKRPSGNA